MSGHTRRSFRYNKSHKKEKKGKRIIGLIYANWCGHCQSLKPEWYKMKNRIKMTPEYKKGNYVFSEIENSDPRKDIKMKQINKHVRDTGVSANGFPTIFKISKGSVQYYEGEREANSLGKWFMENNNIEASAPTFHKDSLPEQKRDFMPLLNRIFGGTRKIRNKKN